MIDPGQRQFELEKQTIRVFKERSVLLNIRTQVLERGNLRNGAATSYPLHPVFKTLTSQSAESV